MENTTDVLVFCALPEEAEYFRDAVKRFCGVEFVRHPDTDTFVSYHATITAHDGNPLAIRLAFAGATGAETTSPQLTQWLTALHPVFVGMTGVCAGNPEKTQLGDIIVSQHAYNDVAGKMVLGEEAPVLNHQLDTESIDPRIRSRIQDPDFHREWEGEWKAANIIRPVSMRHQREWLLDRLDTATEIAAEDRSQNAPHFERVVFHLQHQPVPTAAPGIKFLSARKLLTQAGKVWVAQNRHTRPIGKWPFQDRPVPAILPGVTACVPYVVAHGFFQGVQHLDRNLIAAEMESLAFYRAANTHFHDGKPYLLVKGVCDYADPDKDDSCRDYAGLAAASFLLYYIRRYVKPASQSVELGTRSEACSIVAQGQQVSSEVPKTVPSNLPQQTTSFINRAKIIEHVNERLDHTRIVTITGIGGAGKTRIAIACAEQRANLYTDGVHFVSLVTADLVADPAAVVASRNVAFVAQSINSVLRKSEEIGQPETLFTWLKTKNLLLVLDNFETAACEEVARYLIQLVTEAPDVYLLVTGREPIGVDDLESLVDLNEGMENLEARQLFLDRAGKKVELPDPLPPESDKQLARIIGLTDRIPLALELAAAHIKTYSLYDIAEGIEATPLGEMSEAAGYRADDAISFRRHCSLERSMRWSYNLLSDEAKKVLATISLFADTFDLAALRAANGEPAPRRGLGFLVNASLVRTMANGEALDTARFHIHRATREFAARRLSESPTCEVRQKRFIAYYRHILEEHNDTLLGVSNHPLLDNEWRNILAAAELAERLQDYNSVVFISKVGNILKIRGFFNEMEHIYNMALKATRILGNRFDECDALNNIGNAYRYQGHLDKALSYYNESLRIHQQMAVSLNGPEFNRNHGELNVVIHNIGVVYNMQERWEESIEPLSQSAAVFHLFQRVDHEIDALSNLGSSYLHLNRQREAMETFQRALLLCNISGKPLQVAMVKRQLGTLFYTMGNISAAIQLSSESLALFHEYGDPIREGTVLVNLALAYEARGDNNMRDMYVRQAEDIFATLQANPEMAATQAKIAEIKGL